MLAVLLSPHSSTEWPIAPYPRLAGRQPHLTYLVRKDCLLKSWARHCDLSRLLASTPNALAVRRLPIGSLHHPQFLALLYALLQNLVKGAFRGCGRRIGCGDIRLRVARVWVIRGDLVDRRGGCGVGGADDRGKRPRRDARAESA